MISVIGRQLSAEEQLYDAHCKVLRQQVPEWVAWVECPGSLTFEEFRVELAKLKGRA